MRKRLLTAASVIASSLIVFTSCLGDSESTTALTNQYAYINSDSKGVYASLPYYLGVRSKDLGINGLKEGDCAVISFKYNRKNYENGVFNADYITVREDQIYKKLYQTYSELATVDTTAVLNNGKYYFESIENTSLIGYSTEFWDNKWFFSYKYTKGKGNLEPTLQVVYDASKQTNQKGEKEEGVRYIDLRLVYEDGDNTMIGDLEAINKTVVLDLTTIREKLATESGATTKDKIVEIKVRYLKGSSRDNPLKLKTNTETSNIKFDYRDGSYE